MIEWGFLYKINAKAASLFSYHDLFLEKLNWISVNMKS